MKTVCCRRVALALSLVLASQFITHADENSSVVKPFNGKDLTGAFPFCTSDEPAFCGLISV